MRCKPDDLAIVVCGEPSTNLGKVIRVKVCRCYPFWGNLWTFEGELDDSDKVDDECLRPIRDQPGNEQFVVESRKTLPRKKPVTGPVTIDVRGEVVK